MKLFELNRVTYEIEIAPEALMLSPLSKIVSRDKSKDKSTAKNELAEPMSVSGSDPKSV